MKRYLKNIIMLVMIVVISSCLFFTLSYIKSHNNVKQMSQGMENNFVNDEHMPPDKPDGDKSSDNRDRPLDINKDNFNINNSSSNSFLVYYLVLGIDVLILSCLICYLILSCFNKKIFKEAFCNKDKILIYILLVIILIIGIWYLSNIIINNTSIVGNNDINGVKVAYLAETEIVDDKKITSGDYSSSDSDKNAILVSGDIDVEIDNVNVDKVGDSAAGDKTSFYGINSAIIAKTGANLTLKNLIIKTNAVGANGVFSYGGSATTVNTSSDGTTVNISDSTIVTKKDNSGGIMTTGGGNTNAYNLNVKTSGISSAAIRTDRGGGKVFVDGGTYTTTGSGSPTIYSTAEVTVKNASLISNSSEGIVVEGKNTVLIDNCDLVDSNTKLNGLSTAYKNIFLYQSMSGDADTGTSSFTATNSRITTNNGDTFYITNTSSIIDLMNNTILNNDSNGNFLRVQTDSWGTKGKNGGDVTLNMTKQSIKGNIVVDDISTLAINMKSASYYEGVINSSNKAKNISLVLDSSSKIKLLGDCYVSSFSNEDIDNSNIDFNGYKLYVNNLAI